ncbi:hypothetical protein [Ottowia sp. VDI28]|uniref:hypothetical protein n=1 Tax=Ottowia sp. VDI28 TaxID=3133968 RepID=UPI003C2CA57E
MIPPLSDLEARARWHLEIGYPAYPYPVVQEEPEYDDDYDDGYEGLYTCWKCGGEGIEVFCCDDLCQGQDYCMHGDGQRMCPECHGEGVL